jgi:lipopolysaccharide export system protein LptA
MMSMPGILQYCRPRGQLAAIAFVIVFGASFAANAQSSANNVPNAMQGFAQNRDQPIQIEAASLAMRDKKKEATFSGNVKVVQGDTTMTSKTLVVFYESSGQGQGQAQGQGQGQQTPPPAKGSKTAAAAPGAPMQSATPGPGGSSSIKRLEAHGNVVVTQKDQVVTGETAIFDTKTNLITMVGGVVLTQCKNVLRGDRLFVDMTTGVSRVESDSGKVQGLFINSGGEGGGGCAGQAPGQGPSQTPNPSSAPSSKPGVGSPLSILNPNKPK